MRLKSPIALALLLSFSASSLEAVAGVARDGAVHHESAAAALTHSAGAPGDHGHEDVGSEPGSQPRPHGPGHQHGTAADHCTHVHGAALSVTGAALALAADRSWCTDAAFVTPLALTPASLFRPPRI